MARHSTAKLRAGKNTVTNGFFLKIRKYNFKVFLCTVNEVNRSLRTVFLKDKPEIIPAITFCHFRVQISNAHETANAMWNRWNM